MLPYYISVKKLNLKWRLLFMLCFLAGLACRQPGEQKATMIEDWKRIGPGGGGSTFIPTFSYADPKTYLLRCDMTGAYLTHDGGDSFSQINYPNGSQAFAFDPNDKERIYIGASGLHRSTDGGKTRKRIFPPEEDILSEVFYDEHADYELVLAEKKIYQGIQVLNGSKLKHIKVDPVNSSEIYFSIGKYLFYTENDGALWDRIELNDPIEYIYADSSNILLVFSGNSRHEIKKGEWTVTSDSLPQEIQPAFSFAAGIDKSNGQAVFYALHNDDVDLRAMGGVSPTTLWISNDRGQNWHQTIDKTIINEGNETPTYSMLATAEYDAGNVYIIASSYTIPKEDGTIAHYYGALKSEDAGNTWDWVWKGGGGSGQYAVKDGRDAVNLKDAWVQSAFGGEYVRLMDVGVAPYDGNIAIITDWYRTMKTLDGGLNWVSVYSREVKEDAYASTGLDVTTAYGLHFDPFDADHLAISYTDIGYHHSFDGGETWTRSTEGIPPQWHNTCYWVVFDPAVEGKMWSAWSYLHDFPRAKMMRNPNWKENGKGGVAVSTNSGNSWTTKNDGMGFDSPTTCLVLDEKSPVVSRTLYASVFGKGVFKSVDGGDHWVLKNSGLSGSLAAFELTLLPNGNLYLITTPVPQHKDGRTGREVDMGSLYVSKDGAETWTKVFVGDKVRYPNGLCFDPGNPQILYLAAWADVSLNALVGRKVAQENGGNTVFDLDGGIFKSVDGGISWMQIFDEKQYVYDVTVDERHPGRIYCNTFNQGAFRSDDEGQTWHPLKGYDFQWGHRVIVDIHDPEKVYLATYGSSVWHGNPIIQ